MWPMFVDFSDEECKRVLRSLELEAYSSIINAFRAQGTLTKDRKKMLQELCSTLSISMERHRAEVRRAVNDEHLNTIAERLFGPNTATEWATEGRRVVPLMQRLAPQTVFTEIANSAASAQAVKNASLPLPGKTGSREITNGIETMACRKRKDFSSDSSVSPQKMSAMDTQYFHNLLPFDNTSSMIPEPSLVPDVPMSSENFSMPEVIPLVSSSFTDLNAVRNVAPLMTNPMSAISPSKSPSKHPLLKPTSTVTTFSSFDQMTSNLLASRAVSQAPVPAKVHEEQVSTVSEAIKPSSDLKSAQRPLSSLSSMKSSTIVIPTPVSSACSPSASKDRLQTPSSSSSSSSSSPQSNKFLTQIRSKTPTHARQNLPAGLGIKLNPQHQISQRATVSQKSPNMKAKQDNTSIFSKKTSASAFSSSSGSDNPTSQFSHTPSSSSESLSVTKSPISVTKSSPKSEHQTSLTQQQNAKQTTVAKSLPKTTAHSSQYISRSLFSTANKTGAKNLSPVIFNVSSTCTPLQTTTKTTGASQNEPGKTTTAQLLSKSTAVGIGPSHLKINTSNAQTIQYRNDGGLVRSARIVNISQPVGSRLPCAISPSAISALGLSTNLSSTALRVTLPAGTLNTSSSIRVSAAAKPNVIVVHKASMWPRAQQGAAVIMSSTPLTKLPNDIVQETLSMSQKQDKSKPSGSKLSPRTIAPARPQSPAVASVKVPESSAPVNPSTNAIPQPDSSTSEAQNLKSSENTSEAQCKKNLLADIIEASGILRDSNSPDKSSLKTKGEVVKNSKELSNHQEVEKTISQKSSVSSSTSEATPTRLSESNTSKVEAANNSSGDTALTVSSGERNGVGTQKQGSVQAQSVETQRKDASNTVVSSSHITSESVTSSSECGSKVQKEATKDKDS